jgi:VCBS repeat-containing protein
MLITGTEGNDVLTGTDEGDWLDGGPGNDSLNGMLGDDVYYFGEGSGMDTVSDPGGADRVVLGGYLSPADVTIERTSRDVVVTITGTGERLVLQNWFASPVESIEFFDGTVLDRDAIERIVNNRPPVAFDDLATVAEDATAPVNGNVLENDFDQNGDALRLMTQGTYFGNYGVLELDGDGSYRYTLDSSLPAVQSLGAGQTLVDPFSYGAFAYVVADDVPFFSLTATGYLTIEIQGVNDAPMLVAPLADQSVTAGAGFSFALPAGAFTDVDNGDRLSYGATLADGSALPGWLAFDAATGTFSGTAPVSAGATTLDVQVTASDLAGATASDVFALAVAGAPPAEEPPAERPFGRHIVGTRRKNHLDGTAGDDLIEGRDGNDRLHGKGGVDILQGGKGNDELKDRHGNTLFDGGRGNDRMTGGRDDDFFAGGRGNDRLYLGGGHDVVAFNKGDGVDRLFGERQDGVLSLGGGIRYEDLKFSKQGADLVLKAGGGDRIVLEDWYRGKQSIVTLQVVAEAMRGFSQDSGDPLRDDRVETFDFRQLVQAYDDARASHRNLQNWKLMNELLDAHLGGSDTAAYGGDVAYRYGLAGTLAGVGWAAARDTVAAPEFGSQMQALHPAAEVNSGPVKLG